VTCWRAGSVSDRSFSPVAYAPGSPIHLPSLLPARRYWIIHLTRRKTSNQRAGIMRISTNLYALAMQQLIGGAWKVAGVRPGAGAVEGVVVFLTRHFRDHSSRLTEALEMTNERAWRALEVALAGDSLWDRCKLMLARGEDKAFREQVQPFLDACPL